MGRLRATARRRYLAIVICVGLAGGLAALYGTQQTALAESTVKVLVRPAVSSADQQPVRVDQFVNMETEAQVAKSGIVAEAAVRRLSGRLTVDDLIQQLTVRVPQNTQVLTIMFRSDDPGLATAGARAVADAYLEYRLQAATQSTRDRLARLQRQEISLEGQVKDVTAKLNKARAGSSNERVLSAQLVSLQDQLGSVRTEINNVQDTSVNAGSVIQSATAPAPAGRPWWVYLALGLLGGGLVGLGVATLLDRADRRILGAHQLADEPGLPMLAVIPRTRSTEALADATQPDGPVTEAFRLLRNQIFLGTDSPPRVVAVSSADPEGSATDVAVELATLLERSGRRIHLVGTQLQDSRFSELLDITDDVPGLADVLRGDAEPESATLLLAPFMWVTPPGTDATTAADLLGSARLQSLMTAAAEAAEAVIVDTAPALTGAGQAVLTRVDAVVLVVRPLKTTWDDLAEAVQRAERSGARLLGAVVDERATLSLPKPAPAGAGAESGLGGATRPSPHAAQDDESEMGDIARRL